MTFTNHSVTFLDESEQFNKCVELISQSHPKLLLLIPKCNFRVSKQVSLCVCFRLCTSVYVCMCVHAERERVEEQKVAFHRK